MARIRAGNSVNPASIDHAGLGALESDDHLHYHTDARGDLRYAPIYDHPLKTATVTVSSAELLALNATPKTLVAAPGAGKAIIFVAAQLWLDYATTAYAGIAAGEDLAIRQNNASGTILATVEATGFLDATADAYRYVQPTTTADRTPISNAPLVLHMTTGEIITGDSPLKLRVMYREIDLTW